MATRTTARLHNETQYVGSRVFHIRGRVACVSLLPTTADGCYPLIDLAHAHIELPTALPAQLPPGASLVPPGAGPLVPLYPIICRGHPSTAKPVIHGQHILTSSIGSRVCVCVFKTCMGLIKCVAQVDMSLATYFQFSNYNIDTSWNGVFAHSDEIWHV